MPNMFREQHVRKQVTDNKNAKAQVPSAWFECWNNFDFKVIFSWNCGRNPMAIWPFPGLFLPGSPKKARISWKYKEFVLHWKQQAYRATVGFRLFSTRLLVCSKPFHSAEPLYQTASSRVVCIPVLGFSESCFYKTLIYESTPESTQRSREHSTQSIPFRTLSFRTLSFGTKTRVPLRLVHGCPSRPLRRLLRWPFAFLWRKVPPITMRNHRRGRCGCVRS